MSDEPSRAGPGVKATSFRVATYNVHGCVGIDRRLRPERIVEVLREIDADVIALQEVFWLQGSASREDQAHFLARELAMDLRVGENRRIRDGAYGNVVLSRLPLLAARNHDISVVGREQRGCLRVDVDLHGPAPLHVFNVHLGTSQRERGTQAERLLTEDVLASADRGGPCVLLGDFNEWRRGLASRLLGDRFRDDALRVRLGRTRTYPGVLPLVYLDHIYLDDGLEVLDARLHRSRSALLASDHLPLWAELRVRDAVRDA